jgi:hypothetical protein
MSPGGTGGGGFPRLGLQEGCQAGHPDDDRKAGQVDGQRRQRPATEQVQQKPPAPGPSPSTQQRPPATADRPASPSPPPRRTSRPPQPRPAGPHSDPSQIGQSPGSGQSAGCRSRSCRTGAPVAAPVAHELRSADDLVIGERHRQQNDDQRQPDQLTAHRRGRQPARHQRKAGEEHQLPGKGVEEPGPVRGAW